jgi:hypothetical protein
VGGLQRAGDMLKEGGLLVIETPNVRSVPMKVFGRFCTQLDAPRHVQLFTPLSLRLCVERAGLDVVECGTFSPSTMEYSESLRYVIRHLGLRRYERSASSEDAGGNAVLRSDVKTKRKRNGMMPWFLHAAHELEVGFVQGINRLSEQAGCGNNLFLIAKEKERPRSDSRDTGFASGTSSKAPKTPQARPLHS